jgi:hypothetical protein
MTSGLAILTGCPGGLETGYSASSRPDIRTTPPMRPRRRSIASVPSSGPAAPLNRLRQIAPDVDLVEGDIRDPRAAKHLCGGADGATVFHLVDKADPRTWTWAGASGFSRMGVAPAGVSEAWESTLSAACL